MARGDWAIGSTLKPLRVITDFDPSTGQVTSSNFECEIYSPLGNFLKTAAFAWHPADPNAPSVVAGFVAAAIADICVAEGLLPHG